MNNWILFAILFSLFLFILKYNNYDFAEPSALFCTGFFVGSLFLALNTNKWNYEIGLYTIFIICFSIICFTMGTNFGKKVIIRARRRKLLLNLSINNNLFALLLFLIMIICCLIRLFDIYDKSGSINILSGAIQVYRFSNRPSRFSSIISICDACIAAVVIYEVHILVEKILTKEKRKLYPIVIIALGLIYYALSSSRIELIYIFIYIITDYLADSHYHGKRVGIKEIRFAIILVFMLFGLFFAAGYLTGKSQVQTSAFDNISLYTGSSIGALDSWLNKYSYTGEYFGSIIFRGVSNFLALFNIHTGFVSDPSITFINLGNMPHTTNVFTCIAELMSDVGTFGCFFVLFIEGVISQMIYKKAKLMLTYDDRYMYCLYLYLAPLLTLSSISERLFTTFFTISTVVFIVLIRCFLNIDDISRRSMAD